MVRTGGVTRESGQMKGCIPEEGLLVFLEPGRLVRRLVRLRLLACSRQKALFGSSPVDGIGYKPFHIHTRAACASGEGCGTYPCLEPTPSQASAGADGALPPPPPLVAPGVQARITPRTCAGSWSIKCEAADADADADG